MEVHRPDAVLTWIGHSARVALDHYAPGPTESDYQKAVQNPGSQRLSRAIRSHQPFTTPAKNRLTSRTTRKTSTPDREPTNAA